MSSGAAAPKQTASVAELSRRYRFSAMHRLHVNAMSDAENRVAFGKCNNPYGHGHNYTLQVSVRGPVDAETGMVINLAELDAYVRSTVLERFDQSDLNTDPAFASCVPSTENLAEILWSLLAPLEQQHPTARLTRVRVEETSNNAFDFFGPGVEPPRQGRSRPVEGIEPTR